MVKIKKENLSQEDKNILKMIVSKIVAAYKGE